jgi:hypothetical protein
MSFFVSDSIKDIVDEESLIESTIEKEKSGNLLSVSFLTSHSNIKFDLVSLKFESKDWVHVSFYCYGKHLETIFFNTCDTTSLKIGSKSINIQEYNVNSILEESENTYIMNLLCRLAT